MQTFTAKCYKPTIVYTSKNDLMGRIQLNEQQNQKNDREETER